MPYKIRRIPILAVSLVCLTFSTAPYFDAQAQLIDERIDLATPVSKRIPQELENPGLTYKGFIYKPELETSVKYNSNVLAQEDGETSDQSVLVSPSLSILKRGSFGTFLFEGKTDIERFASETDENEEDYNLSLRGRIDANSRWNFPVSLAYKNDARDRRSALNENTADERLDIDRFIASAGVTRVFNRLSLTLLGRYEDISNEDGTSFADGSRVVFSDDDRQRYEGRLRVQYAFPRGSNPNDVEHIVFADFSQAQIDYKNREFVSGSFSGAEGDFDEYSARLGFQTDYKDLIFANISAGYTVQEFDDSTVDDTDAITASADISYMLTPKLMLNADVSRNISQDNGFFTGVIQTSFDFGADYELLHNTYLGANIGYSQQDFDASTREDDDLFGSAGLRYIHSRHFTSELEASYFDRDSNEENQSFDQIILMYSLKSAL